MSNIPPDSRVTRKVIVTGGRDYQDWDCVRRTLDLLRPDLVIQGGATGADTLARRWANDNKVECLTYHADWDCHGKAAGVIRNTEMLEAHPEAFVLAFPGGKGTANCVRTAKSKKMLVLAVGS